MTEEQILKKAIEKAVGNGFSPYARNLKEDPISNKGGFLKTVVGQVLKESRPYEIIFSHDFAISFFGEKWKERLQEMVICKEPLKYLEKYL